MEKNHTRIIVTSSDHNYSDDDLTFKYLKNSGHKMYKTIITF
jgi:hypothetical protein